MAALIQRIEERLKALGLSPAAASKAAGLSPDFIRDLKRGKVKNPGADALSRLAQTLKVSPDYLLRGEESPSPLAIRTLRVVGVIQAGQFRDISLANQDEDYPTVNVVPDERFRDARQYALLVSGDSMDQLYPSGSYVICAEWGDTGLSMKPGLVLHVERYIAGTQLVETTLKEVVFENGSRYLAPRSSNPRHKRVQILPDNDMSELKVRGVVIGTFSHQLI